MVTPGLERSAFGRERALRRLTVPSLFRGDEIGFSTNRLISEGLRHFYERCLILFPIYISPKHDSSHCAHTIPFDMTRFWVKIHFVLHETLACSPLITCCLYKHDFHTQMEKMDLINQRQLHS